MLDEVGLQAVGSLQRVVAVAQRRLDAETIGDIGEGDQAGAIGEGEETQRQDGAIVALDLAQIAGDAGFRDMAWISRSHIGPLPNLAVAGAGDGADMRFAFQLFRLEIPDAAESGIVQFQASIRSEHRHRFAQRVERCRLHLHQRVVVGLQSQLLADILVKECEPAERMGLAHHPQGLAAGKVPILFPPG